MLIPALIIAKIFSIQSDDLFIPVGSYNLLPGTSALNFVTQFRPSDIAEQINYALVLLGESELPVYGVLDLWPPGLPFLYALLLSGIGSNFFPLKMALLGAFFYGFSGFTLSRAVEFAGPYSGLVLKLLFILPLIYSSFANVLFSGIGIYSSDFYCFCLLTVLFSLIIERQKNLIKLTVLALVISSLIYLRSYYYIIFTIYFFIFLLVFIFIYFINYIYKFNLANILIAYFNQPIFKLAYVFSVVWLLLLPWKIFYIDGNSKNFSWTATDQAWSAQWRDDYPSDTFLVGINTACLVEKVLCDQLSKFQPFGNSPSGNWSPPELGAKFYKNLSLVTFFNNPVSWYNYKLGVLNSLWFDGVKFINNDNILSYILSLLILIFCILSPIIIYIILMKNKNFNNIGGIYFLYIIFLVGNLIVFTFIHYEPRYSIPLKWISLLLFIYMAINFINLKRKG